MRHLSYEDVDDEKAAAVAQDFASTEYSHETELELSISNELTVSGAQVIAHGLKQSQVTTLDISFYWNDGEPSGNALQPIFEVAIQHLHLQALTLGLNNDITKTLSDVLLSLDADNGANDSHALQTLKLYIGPNLTEGAFQQLAHAMRHVKLKRLELNGYQISRNIISTFYREAARSVEELELDHPLSGEDAVAFGNVLMGNTTLQSVNVYLLRDLSIHGAVRLANGISKSHIVRLEMTTDTSGIRKDVEDALYDGVARSPTIQHLVLGMGLCGTSGLAGCLTRLHTLQTHHTVRVADVPSLMTGLISALHLTSLELVQRFDNEQDMLTVCAALPQLVSLTSLTICCQLAFDEKPSEADDDDDDDVVPNIDLRLQHVQPTGAEKLMVAVANHPSLVCLTSTWFNDIGFAGLAMIGTHLPNIKLKSLDLRWLHDEYDLSDKDESVQQAFQRACQALVAGVQSNWHLHDLTLPFEIKFPPNVTDEIDFYLDLNKSGRYLLHDTDSEKIPTGLWCHVFAKCSNKAGLIFYHLRELPTLAYGGNGHVPFSLEVQNAHTEWPKHKPAGTKRRREEQMS